MKGDVCMHTLQNIETTKIHKVLLSIGIPPNLLGYAYIITAIELITQNPFYLRTMTKCLYQDIAIQYDVSVSSVERAIRNAISVGWLHGNIKTIDGIFYNCVDPEKGFPSNSIFLTRLYHYFNSEEFE